MVKRMRGSIEPESVTCKAFFSDDPDTVYHLVHHATIVFQGFFVSDDDSCTVSAGARTHRPHFLDASVLASPGPSTGSVES